MRWTSVIIIEVHTPDFTWKWIVWSEWLKGTVKHSKILWRHFQISSKTPLIWFTIPLLVIGWLLAITFRWNLPFGIVTERKGSVESNAGLLSFMPNWIIQCKLNNVLKSNLCFNTSFEILCRNNKFCNVSYLIALYIVRI